MTRRAVRRRTRGALLAAATVLLGAGVLVAVRDTSDNANGVGTTYRDEWYALSAAEVRDERLGALLVRDLAFQDGRTDLRVITGVDPGAAVAARIAYAPGTPAQRRPAWLLMSTDADVAADPWAHPDLAAAVRPR